MSKIMYKKFWDNIKCKINIGHIYRQRLWWNNYYFFILNQIFRIQSFNMKSSLLNNILSQYETFYCDPNLIILQYKYRTPDRKSKKTMITSIVNWVDKGTKANCWLHIKDMTSAIKSQYHFQTTKAPNSLTTSQFFLIRFYLMFDIFSNSIYSD